jgi:hypothetical protein
VASQFASTDAVELQREVILPGIRQFMNSATPFLKHIEKEIQPSPTGEFLIVYNKERNNNAAGGRPETGVDLPSPVAQKAGRSTVPSKQLYTRVSWTGKVVAATKTKDSLVDAIVYQTEGAARDHKHAKNRQVLGDERDALGFYVSGAGGTAVVVNDQWGNIGGDLFQSGNTTVDLINGSTHAVREADIVLTRGALGGTGRAMTADAAISGSATAGDYFVPAGAIAAGVSYHLTGIRATIAAGNPPLASVAGLQGVPVATVPEFAASIVGSDGTTYSDWVDLQYHNLQRVLTEIDRNSDIGSEGVAFILTSPSGYDTYVKLCKDERITVNSMTLDGGFKGVSFNHIPMVKDKQFRLGAYAFINPSTHKLFSLAELDWDEASTGSMFYRLSGGDRDGIGATLKEYSELGVIERNGNGMLVGINMLYN